MGVDKPQQMSFAQNAFALVQDWTGTRKQISMWLDLKLPRDIEALEIISHMKSKREFRRSVILGLKIVWAAGQGDYEPFFEAFPKARQQSKPQTVSDNGDLKKQIEELRRLILEQGRAEIPQSPVVAKPNVTTGSLLTNKKFDLPAFDDDDELPSFAMKKNENINAAANLIDSVMRLQ